MKTFTFALAVCLAAAVAATAQGPGAGRGMGAGLGICGQGMGRGQGIGMGHGQGMGPGQGMGMGMGMGLLAAWPDLKTPVTGAPFTGTQSIQTQRKLTDGNQITHQNQAKMYRDSQGRMRLETTSTTRAGLSRTFVTIFDPVSGTVYMLHPGNKQAVKHTVPANFARNGDPMTGKCPGGCQVQNEDLGTQVIAGLPATGTRVTRTIPAGAIGNDQPLVATREVWTSTVLKLPVLIKSNDPRFGSSTAQLTNVTQAEPDAALFQVPSDYTVTEGGPGRMQGNGMRGPRR